MNETYDSSLFQEADQATAPLRNHSQGASLYKR